MSNSFFQSDLFVKGAAVITPPRYLWFKSKSYISSCIDHGFLYCSPETRTGVIVWCDIAPSNLSRFT